MINKNYREAALKTYGEACELCGHRTSLEIHHINYQEHQEVEDELRYYPTETNINNAKEQGFDYYNPKTKQLSKDDSTTNLSVLCGNCHSLCHLIDYGKNILKALKERK
jgi:predicted HNH restriction endonuclease